MHLLQPSGLYDRCLDYNISILFITKQPLIFHKIKLYYLCIRKYMYNSLTAYKRRSIFLNIT